MERSGHSPGERRRRGARRADRPASPAWRLAAALPALGALSWAAPARAQTAFDVTGVVVDSADAPVRGAMVVALALPDSVLIEWATTGGDGAFTLEGLRPGDYLLQVTMIGQQTVRRSLAISDANVAAGRIPLEVLAVEMEPLVVSVEHVPFINRRDTLAYNARAFATPPNASVEDLLRRLPGIEVASDGSIKAQGEDVRNVLVDGKEFFGSDPTVATKNLPAEAVEQVKVYDKESDMAEFTGIPDGQEERTINLELREEAKSGYFGRMAGGVGADMGNYGTLDIPTVVGEPGDSRVPYDGGFNLNRFSPTTQLAAIAGLNNINRPAFSWGDYRTFTGGRGGGWDVARGGGSDDGFTETMAVGLNASRDFGDETWIRSSYFLSSLDNLRNERLRQEQLLGSDVSSLVNETGSERGDDLRHRLDLNGQVEFSDGHELRLRADLNVASSSLERLDFQETAEASGAPLNTASTGYESESDGVEADARLTWRKRLNEGGRSLVAEVRARLNDSDHLADLSSTVDRDPAAPGSAVEEILQEQERTGRTLDHSVRLSFTEPVGEVGRLELFGERSATDEDEEKSVFDLGSGEPVFNDLLSSGFERTYTFLRGGLRYNRGGERARLVLGLEVQNSDLNGEVVDRNESVATGYTHLLPLADLRLEFAEGRNLRLRYTTSTREPSMSQLQPFTDNDDPLRVYVGNPDLQPEYTHRLSTDYRLFDQFSFVNLFTFARLSYTTDQISRSRIVDERGIQTLSPVNSGPAWSANAGVNFGTPIRPIGARLNLGYNVTYSRETELVNEVENDSWFLRNTVQVDLENRAKEVLDVRAGARISFNRAAYSLNEELSESYLEGTFHGTGVLYLGPWTLETSMNYQMFDRDVFGSARNVALWQASLSRSLLDERAELELTAFDLLNQNQGVSFTSSPGFIRERRTESLGQFLMLRFLYHLGPRSGMRERGMRDRR